MNPALVMGTAFGLVIVTRSSELSPVRMTAGVKVFETPGACSAAVTVSVALDDVPALAFAVLTAPVLLT